MVKFFKYLLATFAGGLVAAIFLVLIFIGILSAIASSADKEAKIEENTLLILNLEGPISDRVVENPFEDALAEISGNPAAEGLNRILANIEKAKRDENISGIVLETGLLSAGYETIEEIREALVDFKSTGKFVYSFAPIYTQKGYYLASVCDKLYLNPGGMVELNGLYAERTFFKGTLDKIGVEMQIVKHGKFKSAVEPFMLEEMSEPARLQTEVYLNSMWNHLKDKIATARGVDVALVDDIANQMPMLRDPQLLLDNKLIDGLKYKDEFLDELKQLTETEAKDDLKAVNSSKYAKVYVAKETKGFIRDKIAVIYAQGGIDDGSGSGIISEELSKTIRKARRDSSVKAIVLRVNSPGGSALGSEIIWREVELAGEVKPLIVSMGDVAASGGYYISCAADKIVAGPTTLTGSIGIFGMIPNVEGLTEKIGLSFDGVKTNEFSDMPSLTRPFRKEEKEIMQAYIEHGYDIFIGRCADGRSTTKEAIDEIGQGRVWSGANAKEINLIDEFGGLNKAIELAKEAAGLENYRIQELPEIEDPVQAFLKGISGEAKMFIGKSIMGDEFKHLQTLESLKNGAQIQARLPYDISIR
ncbi:signal peptide peptidase SppA [Carboxylicivirga caseinilyticus]|uniref:signal peptide peptidase SppA n=1 Tax=Carboxylicivirga caseinilyticus TaxID=3417572 RepID=UPI003D346251|nr:signal peptide peptidase SppA [Marinilabiliaceae bacterium A049]